MIHSDDSRHLVEGTEVPRLRRRFDFVLQQALSCRTRHHLCRQRVTLAGSKQLRSQGPMSSIRDGIGVEDKEDGDGCRGGDGNESGNQDRRGNTNGERNGSRSGHGNSDENANKNIWKEGLGGRELGYPPHFDRSRVLVVEDVEEDGVTSTNNHQS